MSRNQTEHASRCGISYLSRNAGNVLPLASGALRDTLCSAPRSGSGQTVLEGPGYASQEASNRTDDRGSPETALPQEGAGRIVPSRPREGR